MKLLLDTLPLLIAQTIVEEAVLLSKDSVFSAYPLQVVW
jgi:PIN domain nuclease of toxin-antitoxin system